MNQISTIQEKSEMEPLVTCNHFGLNFVADYERIGTKSWEKFDEIAQSIDAGSIRFPGGIAAETVFDFRDPNRTEVTLSTGAVVKLTSLDAYIQFCNSAKIKPTIILPTACLLSTTTLNGHRTFDQSQSNDLRYFVEQILTKVDPNLKVSFEIGNEYEGFMSSTEYGRVASNVVQIVEEAYQNVNQPVLGTTTSNPDVFVQAWAYSVGGALTPEDIAQRNQQVLAQFEKGALQLIDGVVSHYYYMDGRNSGNAYEQSIDRISGQIEAIANLQRTWEVATGRDLTLRVSEWNVLMRSEVEIGLRQLNPMMVMFTSFLKSGIDALDFWSAQYKATSLADSSGRLMPAGVLMELLSENTVGTRLTEAQQANDFGLYTFSDDSKQIKVLTSTIPNATLVSLLNTAAPAGYQLVNGFIIGVDEATADGLYRDLSGLASYAEPDARVTLDQISIDAIRGSNPVIELEPYESLMLVYTLIDPDYQVIYGKDSSELIYSTGIKSQFIGGSGWDTVSYVQSTVGVNIRLDRMTSSVEYGSDTFVSIEGVIGSSWDDRIVGTNNPNLILGSGGNDLLVGLSGSDTLDGGRGDDTLYGGDGKDELLGGDGDDLFVPGMGNDRVVGGDGFDTLSFIDASSAVSVWTGDALVETRSDIVQYSQIERIVGSEYSDRFVLLGPLMEVCGGGGDDSFFVDTPKQVSTSLYGGVGNDNALVYSNLVNFFGEDGDDTLLAFASSGGFFGGSGDDRATVRGNAWVLEGGIGDDYFSVFGDRFTFIFSGESGNDTITGFNSLDDKLVFRGVLESDVHAELVVGGTLLSFSDDSTVFLADVSLTDLSSMNIEWY